MLDHRTGPLDERPRLGGGVVDGPGVDEGQLGPLDGRRLAAAEHVQLGDRSTGQTAQPSILEGCRQLLEVAQRDDGCLLVVELQVQARHEAHRFDAVDDLDGDLQPSCPRAERLGEEVQSPGRLRCHRQQLGIVRRLGEPFRSEPQGGERQALLEVADRAPAGDRRHLVVAIGALGMASEGRVVEHGGRAHGLEAALVEAAPLPTEQLVDDGVGHECVGEPELIVADLDHHASVDQRAEVAEELVLGRFGDGQQGLERRRSAVDGERFDDAAQTMIKAGQLLAHGLFQRPRQLRGEEVRHDRPWSDDPHQLLDHERDAAAAPVQRLDDRRRGLAVGGGGDGADHRADVRATEALQTDLLHGMPALQPQHQLAARLPAREVVGAVRRDDHEVRPRLLGDAVDQVGAGGVDPVEILDDEHSGTATRGVGDGGVHGVGQGVTGHSRVGQRDDGVERPSHRPGQRRRTERGHARRKRRQQLPDEPGLADARFAGDERHGRLIPGHHLGRFDEVDEAREDDRPADHHRAHPRSGVQHGFENTGAFRRAFHRPHATRRSSPASMIDAAGRRPTGAGAGVVVALRRQNRRRGAAEDVAGRCRAKRRSSL